MNPAVASDVPTLVFATLEGRHPYVDAVIALIVFLAALSVIGSAIWLARRSARD